MLLYSKIGSRSITPFLGPICQGANSICSEVQRLRNSIEAEYQAAQLGLAGYACVARHDFITARLNRIAEYHEQLSALIGKQEACAALIEINDHVISCKSEKVSLVEPAQEMPS